MREHIDRAFDGRLPRKAKDAGSRERAKGMYLRRLTCELLEDRRLLASGPLHVDVDSVATTPDGANWPSAYVSLQAALDRAAVLNADGDAETAAQIGATFGVSDTTKLDELVDGLELVQGVGQIVTGSSPGPVYATSDAWTPIVAGDDDSSFPSTFALAREYGQGRVVAFGYDGIFGYTTKLDTGTFLKNVTRWLDARAGMKVLYTTGHSEWVGTAPMNSLRSLVAGDGYTVSAVSAPLTATKLNAGSVLIVGNPWGSFTSSEIEAIRQFVNAGGGLWLVGLGWSWEPYHAGSTIEDYPVMKVAAPYGVRWLKSGIWDPTNQFEGLPVFHTFYPDVQSESVSGARAVIDAAHAAHPMDLPAALAADADLRQSFTRAHQALSIPTTEFALDNPQRQEVYDYCVELATAHPDFYAKIAPHADATAAWVRERFWRTWRDSIELTPAVKAEIVDAGQLSGGYADLFDRYGVVLLDNVRLGAGEVDFIYRYLEAIPEDLHNMRSISVRDYLGSRPAAITLDGLPGAVNIFGITIGQWRENPFPSDVPAITADTFVSVVAHEINHVVNAYTIEPSAALDSRHDQLITDAGNDRMNYLRSMFANGFFAQAPQEFFASISNQWFCDSAQTLQLGLVRFDSGRPDPINQALFFADVYSQGGDTTLFYRIDTAGNITRRTIPLTRNANGRIDGLVADGVRYEFTLDSDGHVLDYTAEAMPAEVVNRYVFYNNSFWDTATASNPGFSDATAIDQQKRALLPDETATLANYTSYDKGINGIMVDIADLPVETLRAADFQFLVGNSDGLANWTPPEPLSIDVLSGMGTGGADRVTIIWPDGAIRNQWLQVVVRANENTGLPNDDVFYFGNAVGEAGNAAGNAIVNATDEIMARNFFHGVLDPAAIDDPYDYNRDGLVNGTDQIIARGNQTNPLNMLRLITAPAVEVGAKQAAEQTAGADSDLLQPSAAELNWLYELQQMNRRDTKRTRPAAAAVDRLLATYCS